MSSFLFLFFIFFSFSVLSYLSMQKHLKKEVKRKMYGNIEMMQGVKCLAFIGFCMCLLGAVGKWKIFEKAGVKPWHSLIPVLNLYDWYMIAGLSRGWALLGSIGWIFACFTLRSLMPMYGTLLLGFTLPLFDGASLSLMAEGGLISWFYGMLALNISAFRGYMTFGKIFLGLMLGTALVIHLVSFFMIFERFGRKPLGGALFLFFESIMYAVIGISPEWKYSAPEKGLDEEYSKAEESSEDTQNETEKTEENEKIEKTEKKEEKEEEESAEESTEPEGSEEESDQLFSDEFLDDGLDEPIGKNEEEKTEQIEK